MKNFITRRPVWFAIAVTAVDFLLGLVVFIVGSVIGLPEEALEMVALVAITALPLILIAWMGWWQDSGFVKTTQNAPAIAFPLIVALFTLAYFGTVALENSLVIRVLVAMFLTGLAEEALSRGLLVRALLPRGKWEAVLIPAVLFGVSHITQFAFLGMPFNDNLVQIINATSGGILYGAVRLRVNNIWPLIILHMLGNTFAGLAGIFGVPGAIGLAGIPVTFWIIRWALELIPAMYLMLRTSPTATIDGKPVG
jgi:membrane protease YdiL (CAAX protease family)